MRDSIESYNLKLPASIKIVTNNFNINNINENKLGHFHDLTDRLCGLVVRAPGYRSRGPGFHSRRYKIFWEAVGLERGPLSLARISEELLERTVAAPV
jgi:hypothetical protein